MVYETKEQIIKRRNRLRFQFRNLVRKVYMNKSWLRTLKENAGYNINALMKEGEDTTMPKNFQSHKKLADKQQKLWVLFERLKCFSSFSPKIREKLAKAVNFQIFPKGKVLYLEGHPALSMYFIVAGRIVISHQTYDKGLERIADKTLNILSSGEYFGHIGIMYDKGRNATFTTESECELFLLYKEEFDDILKSTLELKYENIKKAMRRFEYFNNYTDAKITECCIISKIEEYSTHEIIYSQHDIRNFSYFVLCGKCLILQCLKLHEKSNGKSELVVPKKKANVLELASNQNQNFLTPDRVANSITDGDDPSIKYQFVDVGTFSVGAVFGIHENIDNRVILAKTKVQCLLIPRNWLFKKAQNVGNVWQRLKLFLNSSIPSQEKLYMEYLKNQKWKKFKKKTIEQIRAHDKISDPETQFYNIPVICRISKE